MCLCVGRVPDDEPHHALLRLFSTGVLADYHATQGLPPLQHQQGQQGLPDGEKLLVPPVPDVPAADEDLTGRP